MCRVQPEWQWGIFCVQSVYPVQGQRPFVRMQYSAA